MTLQHLQSLREKNVEREHFILSNIQDIFRILRKIYFEFRKCYNSEIRPKKSICKHVDILDSSSSISITYLI